MSAPPILRYLPRIALGVIAAVVALELLLQVLALALYLIGPRATDTRTWPDERVVMCVGDSFTFGMGASTPAMAYPAQLERGLRATTGAAWRVVNLGWPGQDSREVLERIDAQLEAHRPRVVCVLIGANDRWSQPAELHLDGSAASRDAGAGFRWRWRTARLLRLIANEWFGERRAGVDRSGADVTAGDVTAGEVTAGDSDGGDRSATSASPDLASLLPGAWKYLDGQVVFAPDGSARYRGLDMSWRLDGRTLRLSRPPNPDLVFECRGGAERLVLCLVPGGEESVLCRFEHFVDRHIAASRRSLEAGNPIGARNLVFEYLHASAAGDPWLPRLHAAMHRVAHATGDAGAARAELDWLRTAHRERGDAESAGCLLEALVVAGALDEASELAARVASAGLDGDRVQLALAELGLARGDRALARTAIERALHTAHGTHYWLAHLERTRAAALADADAVEAARSLIRAFVHDRDRATTARHLAALDAAAVARALASAGLADADRAELAGLAGASTTAAPRVVEILHGHLCRIVERCHAAGAQVVIASYPYSGWPIQAAMSGAAATAGASFAAVHADFEQALAGDPGAELFVADGHCNDAGYARIAAVLERSIHDLVARAPR